MWKVAAPVTCLAVIIYEKSMDDHMGPLDLLSIATGILYVGNNSLMATSIISLYAAVSDS